MSHFIIWTFSQEDISLQANCKRDGWSESSCGGTGIVRYFFGEKGRLDCFFIRTGHLFNWIEISFLFFFSKLKEKREIKKRR